MYITINKIDEIFENHSYFGVSLYLKLSNIKNLEIKVDFLKSVVSYYFNNFNLVRIYF